MGFVLSPAEREHLVTADPQNAACIFPYLGGEEINSSPGQHYDRYVISFGQMSESEASKWPMLLARVRTKVKPERDKVRREAHRKYWWHFADKRPALYGALAGCSRCLVNSQVSKHLVFAWQPTDRIFSHALNVFPFMGSTSFCSLQSRPHEFWARLLASTLEDRAGTARLRYATSDCFETFPFPKPDPRAIIPELEAIGEKLYEARAKYMIDSGQGLTETYNALKDPVCTDERILTLRELHEELDRAVLRAYPPLTQSSADSNGAPITPGATAKGEIVGWSDIAVPPFCIATDEDKAALQAFEDEVIDRLFLLNELRAKEEALQAKGLTKLSKKKAATKKAPRKPKTTAKSTDADEQGDLF